MRTREHVVKYPHAIYIFGSLVGFACAVEDDATAAHALLSRADMFVNSPISNTHIYTTDAFPLGLRINRTQE